MNASAASAQRAPRPRSAPGQGRRAGAGPRPPPGRRAAVARDEIPAQALTATTAPGRQRGVEPPTRSRSSTGAGRGPPPRGGRVAVPRGVGREVRAGHPVRVLHDETVRCRSTRQPVEAALAVGGRARCTAARAPARPSPPAEEGVHHDHRRPSVGHRQRALEDDVAHPPPPRRQPVAQLERLQQLVPLGAIAPEPHSCVASWTSVPPGRVSTASRDGQGHIRVGRRPGHDEQAVVARRAQAADGPMA